MVNQELKLTAPICPSNNHYLGYRAIKSGKKNIVTAYPTTETKLFKKQFIEYIKTEAVFQNWEMDESGLQHYYVDWIVYFPRVDMDAANYDKVIADSITESGCVWKDDNVVCNRIKHIYYDSENPRFELTIHPVEYVGIFDSLDILSDFENRCKKCNRYKSNCSMLRKAKLGKIQEGIDQYNCEKYKEVKE